MTNHDQHGKEATTFERMRVEAEKYGLWHEVKESYDEYIAAGDSPDEAARCALYDWDI